MAKTKSNGEAATQWRFFRAGGFDQVRLDSGRDLANIDRLDRKLWVALACPVDNIHFDKRTLLLIDSDGDRRIRAEELIAAVKWTIARIRDPDILLASSDGIALEDLDDSSEEGRKLIAAGRSALAALSRPETGMLTVSDTEKMAQLFSAQKFNGDGIITEECADNEGMRSVIRDIIAVYGPRSDRSGNSGVDAETVKKFFTDAEAFVAWSEEESSVQIPPFGASTGEAADAVAAVGSKIDDFFERCRIARFDDRLIDALDKTTEASALLNSLILSPNDEKCAALPLARVNRQMHLPLDEGCNPAWHDRIDALRRLVVEPLLGRRETVSLEEWRRIKTLFAPYFEWRARKPGTGIDRLGINRIQEIISVDAFETLLALIEQDAAEADKFALFSDLEKIVRFKRDLYRLCLNFVNFKDFYSDRTTAIFQTGTLYIDRRSCSLCMTVDDANRHSQMAAMAGAYLVYCDCRRRGGADKQTVVAAVTDGDSENLMIGRNGVFYDRYGNDWDATVVKILENPISMKQAFWLPYKNLVRMIEAQVAKRASTAEAASTSALEKAAAATASADKKAIPSVPKKVDVGTVAALGVAVGAIGTFIATLMGYVAGIIRLGPLAIAGAIAGMLMVISGPSLVLAYIKLRKRNLGPILDANGWAINAKTFISMPFGAALTKCAVLPPGSQRDLFDPYAAKKSLWPKIIVIGFLLWIAWFFMNRFGMFEKAGRFLMPVTKSMIGKIMRFY